jgi:hypothetical protein
MISNARTQGTFTASGSHDWFKFGTGTGIGIFDTIGASVHKAQISTGQNYSFAKPMQYSRYSIQDGTIQMDALYVRDFFGLSTHVNNYDRTAYIAGNGISNKNNQDPSTWSTQTGPVPNKVDLIDVYLNMSRQGNSLSSSSPSPLYLYVAATTIGTTGDRYLDFELFKNGVNYNSSTGLFSNVGPAATGGRNIWTFNPDGSLNSFGELSISFSFNSTVVTDIAIYVWVPYSTYLTVIPAGFDFVPGSWTGLNPIGGYGYVKIRPKAGNPFQAWGAVNTANLAGPAWGTNSAASGLVQNQYYSVNYTPGQFAEGAINLTSIGLDPLFSSTPNCEPPFERIMAKSRSSADFNSDLQDFIAPQAFLGIPIVPAAIAPPPALNCSVSSVSLNPVSNIDGASYTWTTSNGSFVSGQNTATPVVNAPGTYTLTTAILAGCTTASSSVVVGRDSSRPVATAAYTGQLTPYPTDSVTLRGGDTTASKFNTPFGGSAGLTFSWSGPNGFTSTLQNPKTNQPGTYMLVLREGRNACTDTAEIVVQPYSEHNVFPVRFTGFSARRQAHAAELSWNIAEPEGVDKFIVQKSVNGKTFQDIATVDYVPGSETTLYYADRTYTTQTTYYRIKAVSYRDAQVMTNILKLGSTGSEAKLHAYGDSGGHLILGYSSDRHEKVQVEVFNSNGQCIRKSEMQAEKGQNALNAGTQSAAHGIFFIRVTGQNGTVQTKVCL